MAMTSKDFIKICFDVGIKHFVIHQHTINEHQSEKYKIVEINLRKHCWKDIVKICNHNRVCGYAKLFRGYLDTNDHAGYIKIDEPIYE